MIKWNKIFLRVAHFFGRRLTQEHIDDIIITLQNSYPNMKGDWFKEESSVHEDLKKEIYKRLCEDDKLKKRIANVKHCYVTFIKYDPDKNDGGMERTIVFGYLDGVLYSQAYDREAYNRHKNIDKIL